MKLKQFKRAAAACTVALTLSLTAFSSTQAADTYAQTKYPVVLVHGLLGFDAIGPINYFYGVPGSLRNSGAVVFTPNVSQSNSTEERGEQLLKQLRDLKAKHGYAKFNLIGHSHGGNTARYVAAVAPDLVSSVTSVGTPHTGSKTADGLKNFASAANVTGLAVGIVDGLSKLIAYLSGSSSNPQNSFEALKSLSTAGSIDFNKRFPQGAPTTSCGQGTETVNGVTYHSYGGTSVLTNIVDISDVLMGAGSLFFGFEQNDGLVGRCSSHWGKVIRDDYPWNHLDEVNQGFGLRGLFTPDPVAMYRAQANRLKKLGL
jgi:triacylglycerol lipase